MLIHDLKQEKKSQRSARRYHNQLEDLGYTGSYDSVRRYVKKYHEKQLCKSLTSEESYP